MKEKKKKRMKVIREKKLTIDQLNKDRINGDIRATFEQEEDYHKLKIVSNFWNNNGIE